MPLLILTSRQHLPQYPRLRQVSHVDEDIVCWVSVQRRTQPLLVEVVSDETDRAAEHEQAVKRTNLNARQPKDITTRRRCKPWYTHRPLRG